MRDVDVASVIAEAVVKFKDSEEFTALLKKDYHSGYYVGAVDIFYNIWAKYQDLNYSFLGGELTNLIGEWIKAEKLNVPDPEPLSPPPGPSVEGVIGAENMPVGAFEQQFVANTDEEAATSNLPPAVEELVGEVTSRVASSRTLIDLKEELATIADTGLCA